MADIPRPRSGWATATTMRCSARGNGISASAVRSGRGQLVARRGRARVHGVEIEDGQIVVGQRAGVARESGRHRADVVEVDVRRRQMAPAALEGVLRQQQIAAVDPPSSKPSRARTR